jgi:hypothetical protein
VRLGPRAVAAALIACAIVPSMARADEKVDCVAAHEDGQVARRAGRFDRAREAFTVCQNDACPAAVRTRCAEFARDLEAAQPSIVVVVQDARGADAGDARVSVDGAPPTAIPAMALRLNPGAHVLRVEAPGFLPADKTITLPEGFKNMQAIMTLERQRPPAAALPAPTVAPAGPALTEPSGSTARATAAWAFAIGGGVSLAGAGVLSAVGWATHSSLKSSCGSTEDGCSSSQVEPLRTLWPASFVALSVGIASAIASAVLFTTHSHADAARPADVALILGPASAELRFP